VHIPGYTFPGSVVGYSPLAMFKLQIELGLRASQFGDDWFKNGANPSGTLQNKARELDPTIADAAKSRFKAAVTNRDVFVTGSDWNYTSLAVPGNESQFLETIKANATQIAAIYRVSPEDIGGESGTSLTYKTLTSDQTRLSVRTLNPWAAKIEWYLSNIRPRPQYAKFDLDYLARGDKGARVAATAAAMAVGIDTQDEARAAENKPPLTPDELAFWQANFKGAKPAPIAASADEPINV
jgi:HK97 family phage portal protein